MIRLKYNLALITPPAAEPISLQEAKKYLRIDTTEDAEGITSIQCIPPGSHAVNAGLEGASIEVLGLSTTVVLEVGSCGAGGSVSVKIQESNNGSDWEDYSNFPQVMEANDNANYEIAYTGDKRYIRAAVVIANAACEFSVNVILDQSDTYDDSYVLSLITTAREYCESFQNRAYITQTWEMALDCFPHNEIHIPKGTLQTIDTVKYKNSTGAETVLVENTDYVYSTRGILGRLCPAYSKTWPSFTPFPLDPVVIEFTCGYGDSQSDVPKKVIQAMLLLISHWYENRIPISQTTIVQKEIEFAVSALLWQDKIVNV